MPYDKAESSVKKIATGTGHLEINSQMWSSVEAVKDQWQGKVDTCGSS